MRDRSNAKTAVLLIVFLIAGAFAGHFLIDHRLAGTISITTFPAGANIYLDGEFLGTTPISIESVQRGFRDLLITKEGYDPWTRLVNIEPREHWSLHLVLADQRIRPQWMHRLTVSLFSPMILAKDRLYLSSVADGLFALDRHSGEIVWRFNPGRMSFTTPLIGEESIYLLAFDGTISAVDRSNGHLIWTAKLGVSIASGQRALLRNGMIYVLTDDGTVLHRIDAASRTKRPVERLNAVDHLRVRVQAVALGKVADVLYLLQPTGRILLVDRFDGRFIAAKSLPLLPLAITASDHFIYILAEMERDSYRLLALNTNDLSLAWERRIAERPTTIVTVGERIAVGTMAGTMQMLNTADGKEYWIYQTGEEITNLVITGDDVYAGTADGSIFAVDSISGAIRWRADVHSAVITLIPALEGLYVATRDGTIRLLYRPE